MNKQQDNFIFSSQDLAIYYGMWYSSKPFDIGYTTQQAFHPLKMIAKPQSAINASKFLNQESQSNGSLMRITPLAVWLSKVTNPQEIKKVVVADVSMTHPNKLVHDCVFIYCMTIRFLLKYRSNKDRAQLAYDHAIELAN